MGGWARGVEGVETAWRGGGGGGGGSFQVGTKP